MQNLWGNGFQTMFYDLIRTSSLEGFSTPLHHYILLPLFLRKDFHYPENHKGLLVRKANMVCLRVRSYNHSFKFSKRCGDDDSQAYSILWAIRLYLSLLYSLYSTVCLEWRKEEKTYPNMSFSLAKAVVNALCLLHITEKLFVQYHHILAGWLHKESTQVHFQFAIPYLMCLWGRWEVFFTE